MPQEHPKSTPRALRRAPEDAKRLSKPLSEGLSEANVAILEAAAVALRSLHGPWIVEDDWNVLPEVLAASRWLDLVDGFIFATELPTQLEGLPAAPAGWISEGGMDEGGLSNRHNYT